MESGVESAGGRGDAGVSQGVEPCLLALPSESINNSTSGERPLNGSPGNKNPLRLEVGLPCFAPVQMLDNQTPRDLA